MSDPAFFDEVAKKATFIVSKYSKEVYDVDKMISELMRGQYKIGAGELSTIQKCFPVPCCP